MYPLHTLHDARYDCGIKCDNLGVGGVGEKRLPPECQALLRQILDGSADKNKVN